MKIVPTNTAQTLIYVVAPAEIPHSIAFSLMPSTSTPVEHSQLMAWKNGAGTWVLSDTHHVNRDLLTAADACVFVIDGNVGMNPAIIDLFREAQDLSLPIHIAVSHSVDGRADFDEVLAIVQRVLDPDAIGRYLPIESDEGDGIAGLFDLLATDLHVLTNGEIEIRSSDPEHVNLTVDKRADVIEILAHSGLSDEQFQSLASGNPISIPALEACYWENTIVKVTPIDEAVARNILTEWQSHVTARWLPTVDINNTVLDVENCEIPLGIGIAPGLARLWNSDRSVWLERINRKNAISDAIECTVLGGLLWASDIHIGDTIRPAESDALVKSPEF